MQPESKGKVTLDSTKQRSTVSIQVKIKQEEDKYIFQAIVCDYFNEVSSDHIPPTRRNFQYKERLD